MIRMYLSRLSKLPINFVFYAILALALLSSVGCFEIIDSDVEVKISCDSNSDCPDGASCDRALNVCTCDDSPGTFAPQCTTCLPQFEGENCDQCSNKKFTGANCDQCSNPRKTGSSCNRCKEGYTGSDCELCADVRYTGDNCDQCSRRFTGLSCNQCAEGFTGENCDVCSDPRYAGEFCDRCSSKFTGPYCTECSSPRFAGPLCDTCAEGYSGEYCEICADQRFKGDNCDECADARYKGPECEQRRYGWRPVTTDNAPADRYHHTMVVLTDSTPNRVFVWGGRSNTQYFDDGGIYDPVKDTWSNNKHRGGSILGSRNRHTMVYVGNGRVIVWGGSNSEKRYGTGAIWSERTGWRSISNTNAPSPRSTHTAVWTGSEMIIWGGFGKTGESSDGAAIYGRFSDGGAYNPNTDSWRRLSTSGDPSARSGHTAVWSGNEMIVWGGWNGENYLADGRRYRPDDNDWNSVSTSGDPYARSIHAAYWDSRVDRMIVWGGAMNDENNLPSSVNDFYWYRPGSSWSSRSGPSDYLSGRIGTYRMASAYANGELYVFGGEDTNNILDTGFRYCAEINEIQSLESDGAPSGRAVLNYRTNSNAAIVDGEFFVWGGYSSRTSDSVTPTSSPGGVYSPRDSSCGEATGDGDDPGDGDDGR